MKLPHNVVVSRDKLLRYLLLPREENDKSGFLAQGGYTLTNWEKLERDLREFARHNSVSDAESSPYGIKYEVRGTLTGPSGQALRVVTVWIKLAPTGETRFVTLFPDREVRQR